eukprot:scaffold140_cov247-Pinguiococcus_pyrenoidosus.AAC.22
MRSCEHPHLRLPGPLSLPQLEQLPRLELALPGRGCALVRGTLPALRRGLALPPAPAASPALAVPLRLAPVPLQLLATPELLLLSELSPRPSHELRTQRGLAALAPPVLPSALPAPTSLAEPPGSEGHSVQEQHVSYHGLCSANQSEILVLHSAGHSPKCPMAMQMPLLAGQQHRGRPAASAGWP